MLKGKRIYVLLASIVLAVLMSFTAAASQENAIKSISVDKITLIEKSDGYYEEEDGKSYFRYDSNAISDITVTYADGSTEVTDVYKLELRYDEFFEFDDGQSADTPWTVGNYTVSFSFMGYEGQYEVEIVESPVEKIVVDDLELCYMGDGYFDEFMVENNQFFYNTEPKKITVYYKDGRTLSSSAEGLFELTGYFVDIYDGQEKSAWSIGKYKCTAVFMGVQASYSVTVKESPVKKIEVEDITLYEGIDGVGTDIFEYTDAEYTVKPEKVTIYYKDGTAFTGSPEEIYETTGYTVNYEEWKLLGLGKHTSTASYLGASTKFTATVKPYPIKSVVLLKEPAKTEYTKGEYIDISGTVLKVTYTDGRSEEVELNCDFTVDHNVYCRLDTIGKDAEIVCTEIAEAYDNYAFFDLYDNAFSVDYTVKSKTIKGIALSSDENGLPILDFTFSDMSTQKSVIYDIAETNPAHLENGDCSYGTVFTDAGTFLVMFDRKDDKYALAFELDYDGDAIVTNYCEGINWAIADLAERAELIYSNYEGVDAYKGLVATDNIDALLCFAASGSDAGKPKEVYKDYYIYTATEIQKSVKDFFALDGIDISCSKNFIAASNTVKIRRLEEPYFYNSQKKATHPVSYTYENGYFNSEYVFGNGKKMSITADSKGRIASYKVIDPVIHKHIMVTVAGFRPTYLKTGLTDGVMCSTCGEILTEQKIIDKLILGRTEKIAGASNTSQLKISWTPVKGATGYELFYKKGTGWKNVGTTTDTSSEVFKNLASGSKFTFAVRAYVIENGKVIKSKTYTTFETATKAKAPTPVISKQNATAIQLKWTASAGATGYKIYYNTASGWKSPGHTVNTSATFKNLTPGSKFSFAIRPYILTANGVVWGEIAYYTAATVPQEPAVAVASGAKGTITLKYSTVRGADAYQIYYKKGNGSYTLYKNYASAGTLNFRNLKSGDSYTFAVRSATKTSGGWIYSSYSPVSVKVK